MEKDGSSRKVWKCGGEIVRAKSHKRKEIKRKLNDKDSCLYAQLDIPSNYYTIYIFLLAREMGVISS